MPIALGPAAAQFGSLWCAICVSVTSRQINITQPAMGPDSKAQLVLEALTARGAGQGLVGQRPGRLIVGDGGVAAELAELLEGSGTQVEEGDDEPLRELLRQMLADIGSGPAVPDAFAAPGVNEERMRGFAEGAAAFYEAAPWRMLVDEDLIRVESPKPPEEMRHFVVLGAGGQTFGIGLFRSPEEHAQMRQQQEEGAAGAAGRMWSVTFDVSDQLPVEELERFRRYRFPVASKQAYPLAWGLSREDDTVVRPGAAELGYLEGVLRAMAQVREEELDSGRWVKVVETAEGRVEYVMALPSLLDEEEQAPPTEAERVRSGQVEMERLMRSFGGRLAPRRASTEQERAQDLADDARQTRGRRRLKLAKRAIELWPDCADAWNVLAESERDPGRRAELFGKGMAAGERALGAKAFKEMAGHFWGVLETRPYMRARVGLAMALEALGRYEEAAEHYREMLRLNPGDNQGVRELLGPALLRLKRWEELDALLEQYPERSAAHAYLAALAAFAREGDTPASRAKAAAAVKVNRWARKYLSGEAEPAAVPALYSPGSPEEGVVCFDEQGELWEQTPGAQQWLRRQKPPRGAGGRRGRKRPG
jgi:tetratricopeptide (TPR) repeat protein